MGKTFASDGKANLRPSITWSSTLANFGEVEASTISKGIRVEEILIVIVFNQ